MAAAYGCTTPIGQAIGLLVHNMYDPMSQTGLLMVGFMNAISAGLLLTWLRAFGEFGATVVLAYNPYSLPVFTYVQFGATGLTATLLPVAATLAAALLVLAAAARGADLLLGRRARATPEALPRSGT